MTLTSTAAARFTCRPPEYQKTRNRGLLLTALEAGLRTLLAGPDTFLVESSQLNGSVYPVLLSAHGATVAYTCWCDWARKIGVSWHAGSAVLPCTHQLLVCWHQLPAATRARLCETDPSLVAAQLAGQAALIARVGALAAHLVVAWPASDPPAGVPGRGPDSCTRVTPGGEARC